jgi:competence protein ComEC
MKRTHAITFFVLFGLALMGGLLLSYINTVNMQTTVVFLNVGQGDAILLSQGKNQILIDGGRTSKELLAHLGRHIPFWDRKIELVIATHPDADHIGGLSGLFRSYTVEKVLTTGAESDTETSRLFQEAAKEARLGLTHIFRGTTVAFPQGGELTVEYPFTPLSKEASDTNEGSMVTRFVYGETSFLLTGDLPHEETVLPEEAPVTVLKAAHHGSKYSTSQSFLERIRPQEAVISVGQNNYGHPDPGVLERLSSIGARIYRTDQQGDIQYSCLERKWCATSWH